MAFERNLDEFYNRFRSQVGDIEEALRETEGFRSLEEARLELKGDSGFHRDIGELEESFRQDLTWRGALLSYFEADDIENLESEQATSKFSIYIFYETGPERDQEIWVRTGIPAYNTEGRYVAEHLDQALDPEIRYRGGLGSGESLF